MPWRQPVHYVCSFQSPKTKPLKFINITQKYCNQNFHLFHHWQCYNLVLGEISVHFCIECSMYVHIFTNFFIQYMWFACIYMRPLRVQPPWHSQRRNLVLACKLVALGSVIRASHSRITIATHFKYLICFVIIQMKEEEVFHISVGTFSTTKKVGGFLFFFNSNYNSDYSLSKKLIA